MFTKCSLGCGLFHILLVMWPVQNTSQLPGSSLFNFSLLNESSAHIGSSLLVSNLCRGLTEHWMSCVLTGHLLRTQSIANCFLPSRVKQSDGLGQGTLPGTFDCWRVFWSIASPLFEKIWKKWITISQISTEASCLWKGDTVLPKLWQVVLCAVTHVGNSEH